MATKANPPDIRIMNAELLSHQIDSISVSDFRFPRHYDFSDLLTFMKGIWVLDYVLLPSLQINAF